jgi:predicted Zn-dependent protease
MRHSIIIDTLRKNNGWSSSVTFEYLSNAYYSAAAFHSLKLVSFSSKLLKYLDDEIAYILAHEYGHLALGHVKHYDELTQEESHQMEFDADEFAIKSVIKTNYDPKLAIELMRRQTYKECHSHPCPMRRAIHMESVLLLNR